MKIHVVELFDPLGIEYCTFWFCSVVEKARPLSIHYKVFNQFIPYVRVVVPVSMATPIVIL
jgi:hypothetical protein